MVYIVLVQFENSLYRNYLIIFKFGMPRFQVKLNNGFRAGAATKITG
jgi:hypothetical protein